MSSTIERFLGVDPGGWRRSTNELASVITARMRGPLSTQPPERTNSTTNSFPHADAKLRKTTSRLHESRGGAICGAPQLGA